MSDKTSLALVACACCGKIRTIQIEYLCDRCTYIEKEGGKTDGDTIRTDSKDNNSRGQ